MRNLHIDTAHMFSRSYEDIADTIKADEIRVVARAFSRNITRVRAAITIAPFAFEEGMRRQVRWDTARWNKLGNIAPVEENHPRFTEIVTEYQRLEAVPTDFQKKFQPFYIAAGVFHQLQDREDTPIVHGLDAVLAAQVTGAWLAFETLAIDLWVRCLKARPAALEAPVRSSGQFRNWDSDIQLRGPGGKMTAIRLAYAIAFKPFIDVRRATLVAALGEDPVAFVQRDEEEMFDTLYALRNVLVHNGGIADEDFCKKIEGNKVLFAADDAGVPAVERDQPIRLDGWITQGLTNMVVNRGVDWLRMADDALTACAA
jgi:hypothetical protein